MKKTLPLTLLLAVVLAGMPQRSDAQNPMSATWAFTAGGEGQSATLNDDKLFASTYVTIGNNISYKETNTGFDVTFSQIESKGKASAPGENETLAFHIIPQKGVTFTPTSFEFDAARFGTGGGYLNVTLKTDDGQSKQPAAGIHPNRPGLGYDTELSHFSYPVSGISSSEGLALEIGIYNLDAGKSVGFANVTISGTYEGSPEEVPVYTLAIAASPEEGGTVSQNPVGTSFNEGTRITLTATENFGYDFVNWTDAAGDMVAEEPSFTHTLTADAQITANFKKVNTYVLDLSIEGGAADYMVALSPEPTLVGGKMMYEEGTNVMLTASSNPILTFTHWGTGETATELAVKMTEDKTLAAYYDAVDYVAGWDFHKTGNNGRKADFYSEGNDAASLILRNADGTTQGWLDKSQMAAGGYEGRPAAVNWKPLADKYYYQTCVDASMHTDLKVLSSMLYNYNAYQKQKVEYSLDENEWRLLGTIDLGTTSKVWKTETFDIPADANNLSKVYIRWIPDYTSSVVGTTADNDGTAISGIYITGTEAIVDDGTAPELLSHIPEADADNASVNGRIVLTFDEKIKVAPDVHATLNDKTLEISATGKTATCEYSGLEYTTSYTFTLPAGAITDLSGNATTEEISFTFSTRTRPTVDKALFDFVVPDDGTFEEAIAAASKRTDPSVRFRIFVKKGTYLLAGDKGAIVQGSDDKTYDKPTTSLNTPNLSIIGEDRDATVFYNEAVKAIEGLGKCQLLAFGKEMKNTYMQDITLKNGMPYEGGRAAALEDAGDKNIFYNITLFGGQDTYLSDNENGRFYFESGTLQGYTDYLCGKGDVFYNRVDLIIRRKGSVITAPSKPKKYGYVFVDCTVKAEKPEYDDNSYVLGRPWGEGTPIAIFIYTTMIAQPNSAGWTEMGENRYPARFAEYNSTTASGTALSLANRKKTFAGTHSNNPELTAADAAEYTIANVMGGDDNWDPTLYTEQLAAPTLSGEGITITWNNSDYALCYAVCRNGNVVDFTTEASYTIPYGEIGDKFTVRAANEMGGLSEASNEYTLPVAGIDETKGDTTPVSTEVFSLTGVRLAAPVPGVNIVRTTLSDGSIVTEKILIK